MHLNNKILTIPNLFSLSRLIMVYPIMFNLAHHQVGWALFWAGLALSTDLIDGFFARRLGQCSPLGRIIDPLFDKIALITIMVFLMISSFYDLPLWFFIFILFRETVVLLCGLIVMADNNQIMESNRIGKISAFMTGLAILGIIINRDPYRVILLWVATFLTLCSSAVYFSIFLKKMSGGEKR